MNNYMKTIALCFKNNKILFILSFITSIIGFSSIFAFAKLVEESVYVVSVNSKDYNMLYFYAIYLGSSFLTGLISKLLIDKLNYNLDIFIEKTAVKQVSHIDYEYFEDFTWNDKIQKAINSKDSFKKSFNHFISITKAIILFLIYLYAIKDFGEQYIFICIGLLLIVIYITIKTSKSFNKAFTTLEVDEKKDFYIFSLLNDKRSNPEIKINKLYDELENRWSDNYKTKEKKYRIINIHGILTSSILNIFFIAVSGYILFNIVGLIRNDFYEISIFSSILIILTNIYFTIDTLGFEFRDFSKINNYTKEYFNVMNIKIENKNKENKSIETIEFNNLSYTYKNTKNEVLKDINFKLDKNNLYLIVGPNGSGKTTFVNNVLGLLKSNASIKINNEISNADIIKDNAYAVFQDYIDYQLTLRENLTLNYNKECDDNKLYSILKEVGLNNINLDSNIGDLDDKGINLSKGQRQIIAIARMILNNDKEIIVLDEPTSHLDPISELEIFKIIKKYSKNKIVLLVSHRLGFAKECDNVVYIKNGELNKIMTHEELRTSDNTYKELYETQKKLYINK